MFRPLQRLAALSSGGSRLPVTDSRYEEFTVLYLICRVFYLISLFLVSSPEQYVLDIFTLRHVALFRFLRPIPYSRGQKPASDHHSESQRNHFLHPHEVLRKSRTGDLGEVARGTQHMRMHSKEQALTCGDIDDLITSGAEELLQAAPAHVGVTRILRQMGTVDLSTASGRDITSAIQPGGGVNGWRLVAFLQDPKTGRVLGVTAQRLCQLQNPVAVQSPATSQRRTAESKKSMLYALREDAASWSCADFDRWMERYQQAGMEAAVVLIQALRPSLLRYFSSQTESCEKADDLLQETWLRIHRVRHTYRPGEPVLPWICAIARRTRIDGYRRTQRSAS